MNNDYTHIAIVLDRSGSMAPTAQDTIGGVNTFIEGQKKLPGKCTLSLVQFDHEYTPMATFVDISNAPVLDGFNYVPRGMTALLDAIGRTINETGNTLRNMPEETRPSKVVFVIDTDGYENASKAFKREKIFEMISHQRDKYKWEFVFLGANQDAIATGASIGIATAGSMTYTAGFEGAKYASLNAVTTSYRSAVTDSISFSDEDRNKAVGKS